MANQMLNTQNNKRASEKGSALIYILIAIALLAALTFSFMEPSSQQTSSQNTFKSVAALNGQIDTIRSAIQECVLKYPNGDDSVDNSGTGTDPGAHIRYPLAPNSTHLPVGYRASDRTIENIRCPGHNAGSDNQHMKIFGGSSGKFMPPPPEMFNDWQYYNGTDGVFFWIETAKSDAYLESALERLNEKFGTCEADVIDATGGAEDLDSDTTIACASGSLCLRVWMTSNAATQTLVNVDDVSCE